MKPGPVIGRAGVVALLTWLSIEIHELGHFSVYALAGHPARMSFQRVSPAKPVPESLLFWGTLGGPAVSFVAAVVLLFVARRRPSFAWVTASFTNASIRVFPCAMDLLRALKGARPFSDEGELVQTFTTSVPGRAAIMALVLGMWLGLSVLVAREYRFQTRKWPKVFAVYALSLVFGIATVILDDLLGL